MKVKNIFLDIIKLNSNAIKGSYIFNKMKQRMEEEQAACCHGKPDTEKIIVTVNKNGEDKHVEIDLDENENL